MAESERLEKRWTVQPATAAEDAEVMALFTAVFGQPIALTQWQWKYADAPVRGMLLRRNGGVDHGKAVAFFGGMPRSMVAPDGATLHTVQNGDVMVLPSERGVFSRQGALHHVAASFFQQQVGPGKTYAFAYGFPNGRHFQLGIKLGLYASAGQLSALSWSPVSQPALADLDCQQLGSNSLAAQTCALDALFAAMRHSWPTHFIGQRSAQRWQTRFMQHPVHRYTLLLVRQHQKKTAASWLGALAGRWRKPAPPLCAVVLREHPDHIQWLDFVGSRTSIATAVATVRDFAAKLDAPKPVMALISSDVAADFAADAASFAPSDIFIPVNARPLDEGRLYPRPYLQRLWLMGGDTDFL